MQVKKRSEIDKKYLWDINSMYGSDKAWQEDVDKALELAEGLSEYRGRIAESASTLLYVLETEALIDRCLENPAVYAYMKRDEDTSDSSSQEKVMKISTVGSKISAMLAFITPELLKEDYSKIQGFIEEEEDLKVYEFALTHPTRHARWRNRPATRQNRSEEHTSELQSQIHLVSRLLLEKKNIHQNAMKKTTITSNNLQTLKR